MDVLAYPFGFNALQPGKLAKVEQGEPAQKAQEISAFWLTQKGERPIYQEYGVDDPAFSTFDDSRFASDFAMFYGATINITAINVGLRGNALATISIEFD